MSKYIRKFQNISAYNSVRYGEGYIEPWLSKVVNGELKYNKTEYEKICETPLTFTVLSAGTIKWQIGSGSTGRTIEYSKNGGSWTSITSSSTGASISVVANDVLRFRGSTYPSTSYKNYSCFRSTGCSFRVTGNPESLKSGLNITGSEPLSSYCYAFMFKNCYGIVSFAMLPAMTLADYCYGGMFQGCSNLVDGPVLPAMVLRPYCYQAMFDGCESMSNDQVLPAPVLVDGCYGTMFSECMEVSSIRCLAEDLSADDCLEGWTCDVAEEGVFYKRAGVEWEEGESGIPVGWSVVGV